MKKQDAWEWPALVLLLAVALAARLWQLTAVPPGLHYDEAIDLKIALDVGNGARPLYVADGWGREGLYYYAVAAVLQIVPYNPLALRLTAVLLGMGLLLGAYFLVRCWAGSQPHSRPAAWLTAAWLAVAYWPLAASRFGVRNISLPFVWVLAVLAFWVGMWPAAGRPAAADPQAKTSAARLLRFGLAGFLAGLTLYTYQPARFTPLILAAFCGYLLVFHQQLFKERWPELTVWGVTAVVVALPLFFILARSGAETGERAFTIVPLTQLLAGDPRPVLQNTLAVAKAFSFSGDPLESYQLPGRPIFVPVWTSLFFYGGLGLALWRWRQPVYAFVLLWLGFALLPSILTVSAPNFNRMILAQIPISFLTAVALTELIRLAQRQGGRWGATLAVGMAALTLISTGLLTWRDYFVAWPAYPGTVAPLNRHITAVADYLEHDPNGRSVVISSANLEDSAPYIVAVSLDRTDLTLRWVDTGQAMVLPAGVDSGRLLITADRWLDPQLQAFWQLPDQPSYTTASFAVFDFSRPAWPQGGLEPLYALPAESNWPPGGQLPAWQQPYPISFCDCQTAVAPLLTLESLQVMGAMAPGETVTVLTTWEVQQDGRPQSLAAFVHLLDEAGTILAQQDGLGYPPHTWRTGDRFAQVHRIQLPSDSPTTPFWLQLGLYRRETGQRWLILNTAGAPVADRILIAARK